MLDFIALAQQCAPTVAPQTLAAIIQVESGFSPLAIGVVGGRLKRQPKTLAEAVATAKALDANGWNFSVGIAQVNRYNLPKYDLSYESAFEPCANLRAGAKILQDCYTRALSSAQKSDSQGALQSAFSCYWSGNFVAGFRSVLGEPSYVAKVLAQASVEAKPIPVVPAIAPGPSAAPAASPQRKKALTDNSPVLLREAPASQASAAEQQAGQGEQPNSLTSSAAIVF